MTTKRKPRSDRKADPNNISSELDFQIALTQWKNTETFDIFDPDQCKKRIEEYFLFCREHGHNPTLTELGNVLGINRNQVSQIANNTHYANSKYARLPVGSTRAITDGYNMIKGLVESMLVNGGMNPISNIFLAKNMGIKDYSSDGEETPKEMPDLERLKTQYLNQLPDKRGDTDE